jgi:hypothetical protein
VSGTAGDRRAAADLLARMERDPDIGASARRAYRGRHDFHDALWWAAHPGTTAPSGAPDPALELRRLRSAAFSREGQESEWLEVRLPAGGTSRVRRAEALALECEAQLERDRADLRLAMGSAMDRRAAEDPDPGVDARDGRPPGPGGFGVSMGSGPGGPLEQGTPGASRGAGRWRRRGAGVLAPDSRRGIEGTAEGDAPGDPVTADAGPEGLGAAPIVPSRAAALRSVLLRRPIAVTVGLALAGVVAGAGVTWAALSGADRPSIGDTPASDRVLKAPSWDTPSQGSPPALRVFNRDPTPEDALPPQFFLDSPAATARILYSSGTLRVWGFLDRGQVCMFVREGEAASGTCTARDSFGYAGITLMLSAEGTTMPEPTTGVAAAAITDLTWTPEGEIQIRSAPLDHDFAG